MTKLSRFGILTLVDVNSHSGKYGHKYLHLHRFYCISLVLRRIFSFLNNAKNLDPSYEMDLDLLDCLGRVKTRIIAKFHGTV